MPRQIDAQELKPGLMIFRRADVDHRDWYCRIKMPKEDRYKTLSLKTPDINAARDKAFEQDADLRFRLKHEVPVFNRPFSQIAKDFSAFQKERSEAGEISFHRWRVLDSHIRTQLNRYVGTVQINLIGEDRWKAYPIWRQKNGKGRSGGRVSGGTIRDEMNTFRSIMGYAASKKYIPESHVFKGKLPIDKVSREEFTAAEYRKLHSFARAWIKEARTDLVTWYRTMAYNFILIMTNTGMRPSEARNLRWRDVSIRTDSQGRNFVILNVRGKGKHRSLVAASNVADYLDRVRALSEAAEPEDFVFTINPGTAPGAAAKKREARASKAAEAARAKALEPQGAETAEVAAEKPSLTDWRKAKRKKGDVSRTLYHSLIEKLLTESGLLHSSSGSRRSTYCFRHTYATFRLSEGVDVYFLSKQMGTSVKMIEDHYGHINPVKNADQILQGMHGWEPITNIPPESR